MAAKDIFAPPSKQELDMFAAPPSKEELGLLTKPATKESKYKGLLSDSPTGVLTEEGLSFGLRPFLKGAGSAIAEGYTKLTSPREMDTKERLAEALAAAKEGFSTGRKEANVERDEAEKELGPVASTGIALGSGLLTAPLTPIRSVKGALALGAGLGGAQALSRAESLKEGAGMTAGGAATAGLLQKYGGKAIEKAGKAISGGLTKLGSTLSGVTEKEIQTYVKQGDKIKDLIKKSGGDFTLEADRIREGLQKNIQATRGSLSKEIGDVLSKASPEKTIDSIPYVSALQKVKEQINPNLYPDQIVEIEEVMSAVKNVAGETGKLNLKEMNELKQFLQGVAKPDYIKGGQIFSRGKDVARAAKGAASAINSDLSKMAPEISKANSQLSRLHKIEESINKNLLKSGGSDAGLLAAGRGANPRSVRQLKAIADITGKDVLPDVEALAAAQRFGRAEALPSDTTGKAMLRAGAGAAAGLLGGGGNPLGAIAGVALSNPAGVKALIDAGRIPATILKKLGGNGKVMELAKTPAGRAYILQQITPSASRGTGGMLE